MADTRALDAEERVVELDASFRADAAKKERDALASAIQVIGFRVQEMEKIVKVAQDRSKAGTKGSAPAAAGAAEILPTAACTTGTPSRAHDDAASSKGEVHLAAISPRPAVASAPAAGGAAEALNRAQEPVSFMGASAGTKKGKGRGVGRPQHGKEEKFGVVEISLPGTSRPLEIRNAINVFDRGSRLGASIISEPPRQYRDVLQMPGGKAYVTYECRTCEAPIARAKKVIDVRGTLRVDICFALHLVLDKECVCPFRAPRGLSAVQHEFIRHSPPGTIGESPRKMQASLLGAKTGRVTLDVVANYLHNSMWWRIKEGRWPQVGPSYS